MDTRKYQVDADRTIDEVFKTYQRQLIVVPTGGGKTIIFSLKALQYVTRGGKVLVLVHRDELARQAAEKIKTVTGIWPAIEKAGERAPLSAQIVIGSIQSLQGKRLERWPANHFALVIADECHHVMAKSWQKTLNRFDSNAKVLGVTATPDRSDDKNLGGYFENFDASGKIIGVEIMLNDLIKLGYLSPIVYKSIPIDIDVRNVGLKAGDFDSNGLGDSLEPYIHKLAEWMAEECVFSRTLVFVPLIATSLKFVDAFKSCGLRAVHVDGKSENRTTAPKQLEQGEIDLICNAMLYTEGFDCPVIDCVALFRLTKSRALMSQQIGRGTRICHGKTRLTVLDPLWLRARHNIIHPAHLFATNEDEANALDEAITENPQMFSGEAQEELELSGLVSAAQAMREKKLREELEEKKKLAATEIDALEYSLGIGNDQPFQPTEDWHSNKPSDFQNRALANWGVNAGGVQFAGHAQRIINAIKRRSEMGLCSPRQLAILRRMKHPHPETVNANDFGAILARKKRK